MMRTVWLFWQLLRYRVAVMLILFFLIGIAAQGQLTTVHWQYIVAAVILACSYISATSFNDLADEKIDNINHAGKPGRLLVTGQATRKELLHVGVYASVLMLVLGLILSPWAVVVVVVALLVNVTYSVPPLIISYRTFLAPLVLSIGYVIVPYLLAFATLRSAPRASDYLLLAILILLFLARINLKDFRDRAGDSKYHKPTLLLKYGKAVTCVASMVALSVGIACAVLDFRAAIDIQLAAIATWAVVMGLLHRLLRAPEGLGEQVIIAVAAIVGNGFLLVLLVFLALEPSNVPVAGRIGIEAIVMALAIANVHFLYRDPSVVLRAYRG